MHIVALHIALHLDVFPKNQFTGLYRQHNACKIGHLANGIRLRLGAGVVGVGLVANR